MGPSLARMARRALDAADGGRRREVIAVSRWSDAAAAAQLEAAGVRLITADLLDRAAVDALPFAPNVIFMAGQKFGTGGDPAQTWAMNTIVPAWCGERFAGARQVVFSTGNVYPLTSGERLRCDAKSTPPAPDRRIRDELPRPRACDVRTWGTARVAGRALPAQLRLRADLRRADRSRGEGARRYADRRHDGRGERDLAGRCERDCADAAASRRRAGRAGECHGCRRHIPCARWRWHSATGSVAHRCSPEPKRRMRCCRTPAACGPASATHLPERAAGTLLDWTAAWVRDERPLLGKATKFEVRDGGF